jgi:hypothetical protein
MFVIEPLQSNEVEKKLCALSYWNQDMLNPLNAELNPICLLLVLLGDFTFMGPCIVSIYQYISNKMQRYTVYLYLETALHVSLPPIIRSAYTCIYRIWYLSHRYCYLPLSWKSWNPQHTHTGSNSFTIAADSSNGVTNTRCCRYRCMRSWWWVKVPPETYREVSRYK